MYTHDPDWPPPGHFHLQTSIGLANGEILIFWNHKFGGSKYPLYSFDGDEWTKRYIENYWEIMENDTSFFYKEHVQILTIKNYDEDR